MSDPIDDKALEEYLKGGSAVSQRYRELAGDDVPPELDRRVLQEAHAAVAKRPMSSRTWVRWSRPLAIAASLVVAVAIVLESGVERDALVATKPTAAPQSPTPAYDKHDNAAPSSNEEATREVVPIVPVQPIPAAPAMELPRVRLAPADAVAEKRARKAAAEGKPSSLIAEKVTAVPPAAPEPKVEAASAQIAGNVSSVAPAAPPVAAQAERSPDTEADLSEVSVTGTRVQQRSERRVGPRGTIAPLAQDPEEWLKDIRQLRHDGEARAADAEWERFLKAYPNYKVAPDDPARPRPARK